jgi:hypothetical protein
MSKINQRMKIEEHITLETKVVVTIHPIYLPFTNCDNCYEITLKKSHSLANSIKKHIVFKNHIIIFKP